VRATPLARRIARRSGLALTGIKGTGPNGRIVADDVRSIAITNEAGTNNADSRLESAQSVAARTRSPPSATQRAMATNLVAAKRDVPHFYLSIDIEVGGLVALRRELNAMTDGPRVSMTHMLVAVVTKALTAAPHMNRVWTENGIVSYDSIDIGLAVDTERGLTSPLVRDLGQGSFYDIVRKTDDVINRARAGRLKTADMQGGAIGISNAGMHDVRYMTSIIPPGQSAILGVGAIQPCFRPDDRGAPVLRHELGIVLSADHRLHTGVSALNFLDQLRRAVAAPLALIIG
jgi:pyruvate dehydrogenase E2 component (dihydrolipoamide acetyltransferase)